MPTTYKAMLESRKVFSDAWGSYGKTYRDFLDTILEEVGFKDKLVQLKGEGTRGCFQVSSDSYPTRPWAIKFFPTRKSDGKISSKSKYVPLYSWNEDTLAQQLRELAEVVGDLP